MKRMLWSGAFEALIFAGTVAACGETADNRAPVATGGQGASAGSGEEAVTFEGKATHARYRVPVAQELEPWATYPVEEVEVEREGLAIKISYPFPEWLVGTELDVELEGTAENNATTFDVTAAELGSGTCTRTGNQLECTEVLPGVPIDRDAAAEIMQRAGRPAEEIAARLRVTDVFATDPIGILTFEVR